MGDNNQFRPIYINEYGGGNWSGWCSYITNNDLANYFPLTGGILTGDMSLVRSDNGERRIAVTNNNINCFLSATGNVAGLYNSAHGWLVQVDTNGNIDLHSNATKGGSKILTTANVKYSNGVLDFYL